VPGVVIDGTTLLPPLTLSPPGDTKSYSVMPATSIKNGAIVLAAGRKLWPLLSPREEQAHIISNNRNAALWDSKGNILIPMCDCERTQKDPFIILIT
jgi:hypothetical protein